MRRGGTTGACNGGRGAPDLECHRGQCGQVAEEEPRRGFEDLVGATALCSGAPSKLQAARELPGRTRGGARTTWNGPTSAKCRDPARCACDTTWGGGAADAAGARAHTHAGHTGTTRRATGPSSRNALTAWNGVPASEGKGHPDGTARHTQRGTRGAGRGKPERHNTRYRPELPELAASAAHTRTGHCTRQGSSGALRHAPGPRQGSLRASPRGSHWRQASSTGPAAPVSRATTH